MFWAAARATRAAMADSSAAWASVDEAMEHVACRCPPPPPPHTHTHGQPRAAGAPHRWQITEYLTVRHLNRTGVSDARLI